MKTEEIINYLEEKEGLQIVNQTENEISFVYHDNAANSHTKVFYIEKTDSGFALSHKSEHYRKRYISYNKDLGLLFLDSYVIKYSIFAAISTRWSIEKHEALFHKDELNKVFMITEDQEKYFVGLCVNGRTITFPWKSNYEVAYQKAQRPESLISIKNI